MRVAPLAFLAVLAGCGDGRGDAAQAAGRLLAAAHARDRIAFEAVIDRGALRDDLRRQMAAVSQANGLDVMGGPSEETLDRMIAPDAFRLAARGAPPPAAKEIAAQMKSAGEGRVCLHDSTPDKVCLLTFARQQKVWRLVGMRATDMRIDFQ